MPVTGNMDQENSNQESLERTGFVESGQVEQTVGNISTDVPSTTIDSEPVSERSQDFTLHGVVPEHVHSTPVDASSDSLDGFKDKTASANESASKPSSSATANLRMGFQDAFAAFASASYRDSEEESPMDVCNDISEASNKPGHGAEISAASDASDFSAVDSCVSSAIDSAQVATSAADAESVQNVLAGSMENQNYQAGSYLEPVNPPPESQIGEQITQTQYSGHQAAETAPAGSDSVYFIQMTDASGQVVTSIIDPNDIPSYTDSVVYKQCMRADGEIETTVVYSAGMAISQEEQPQEQAAASSEETDSQPGEQQIIYAHDINGHLTPIDSAQSFNDVAPPGKQFVYMQDSTGRIIRTVMDADQTMVPGQQVYYTQSDDGRIITSVMDPATAGVSEESAQGQHSQEVVDQAYQQQMGDADVAVQQQDAGSSVVGGTSNFNIDNSMSGLNMLAELSHLTSGQAFSASGLASEHRAASSTDSSSLDQDEFRPIATVTRQATGNEGLESVSSDIADLKVGQEDTLITRVVSHLKDEQTQLTSTMPRDNLFVQWQNLDAMCWMDVVLIMLVNSPSLRPLVNLDPSQELSSTLLITLLKANRQAQILLQNILKKSNGSEISNLQTGAGNTASIQDPKTSKLVCKENMDEIGKAINILYAMREKIWQALQPRLRCERGKHNSPVLVLPLLVREKPAIKQMFTMNYRYVFKCKQCGYSQDDSHTKILPTIPAVPEDFSMQTPSFARNCFECQAPDQRMLMKFEVLHDFVQMHFVKGLPHNRFEELSFDFNDDHYEVTAVVHYKNNPDHFIAWVRNAPGPAWMECDDLKSVITCYSNTVPNIPPSQVHMVMWERRLTPQHTLVMRDTEDTKILASLVLTVQQPNLHQQQPAEQVTRTSTLPSSPATALSSAASATQSNIQGGVMTQTSSYMPRPRGRGRGRGSYGSRGQAASASVPAIRRVSPAITQLSSPSVASNSMSQASPQIIRLPLSALASSGLNLKGGTPGATRYVLVGNNSQAGTVGSPARSTAPGKVVVVRSQGGAANISAAQLLQLLQRTGAISQAGTRITTTVTTSGANSDGAPAGSTTSYIIQQDGTIVAAPADVPASQVSLEKATSGQVPVSTPLFESTNELQGAMETDSSENEQLRSSLAASQTISTLPYVAPAVTSVGQAPSSDTVNQSSLMSTESTSHVEPSAISSDDVDASGDQGGQSASLVQSQQPTRYIQIPNPAGGGVLLCQLSMKDGKMVLVPVDKNIQTQVGGTSILKLSNTQASSPKITIRVPTTSSQVSASTSGSVFAQLQQPGTTQGHRFITLPGTSGNKKIQLITVPRGMGTPQINQPNAKTIIMNTVSSQQTNTTPSVITRLVSAGQPTGADNRTLPQSSNIVIRELKRTESDNITTLTPSSGRELDGSSGRGMSTQTVSVFKDVPSRLTSSGLGTSLLTSPTKQQQKSQENFRYILPGSNTTHILHTGPSGLQGLGQSGRAFTALSSSGTIIGGQLTPSPTSASVETSPMDQDLSMMDSDDSNQGTGALTSRRQMSRDHDTVYIPLGRGRGKARGQRGVRARGGRTPRGSGRSQLWTSDADLIAPVPMSGQKISTLSDLRQIGAHVIEAGSETVDGIPVVSIPDFSTEGSGQSEILSAAQSIISETVPGTVVPGMPGLSDTASQLVLPGAELENLAASDAASQGPRVITQAIPSYRNNHGYDILTQGILGAANTRPSLRQARSLLTGATSTLHTASTLVASLAEATASSLVSAAFPGQQAIGQAEIDTLIQAAQAAAKPSTSGSQTLVKDVSSEDVASPLEMASQQDSTHLGTDGLMKSDTEDERDVDISEDIADVTQSMTTLSQQAEQEQQEETIVSFDESQVSAAERYRMPVELFQPDDESPEKSFKPDDSGNKLAADLPSKLFEDTEMTPAINEIDKSPQLQSRDPLQRAAVKQSKRGKASGKEVHKRSDNSKDINLELSKDQTLMTADSVNSDTTYVEESSRNDTPMEVVEHSEYSTRDLAEVDMSGTTQDVDLSQEVDDSNISVDSRPIDGLTSDVLLKATEEAEPDADLPVKKVGRPRGRPKGSYSKRGGRRKSKSVSSTGISEIVNTPVSDASPVKDISPVVTPESSPERQTPHMSISTETQMLQQSPDSSPSKYSKPNSANVSFASDLLLVKSDDEKENRTDTIKASADFLQNSHQEDTSDKLSQEKQAHAIDRHEDMTPEKQAQSVDRQEDLAQKKPIIFSPAFIRNKKCQTTWDVDSDTEVVSHPNSHFNYTVLTGRAGKPRYRHPSLSPPQESYTSLPTPMAVKPARAVDKSQMSLAAVVVSRSPRPKQKPKSDPTRDPTVIPLVMEENSDPCCTGGSVVTSIDGGEVFTGVVVRHRRENTNWSMSVDEDMEEVLGHLTEEEQKEYCKQLMTVLYIQAGDFSAALGDISDGDSSEEEEEENITASESVGEGENVSSSERAAEGENTTPSGRLTEEEMVDQDKANATTEDKANATTEGNQSESLHETETNIHLDSGQPATTSSSRGRSKKRKPIKESATLNQSTKKARFSQDECESNMQSPQHPANCSVINTPDTSSTAILSRVNGIDTLSSPAHSSQTSDSDTGHTLQKDATTASSAQLPFHSPSRRSSRTPIPSKKVLDSWDEYPARSALIDRRALSLSSDDELSGYSSGDKRRKKQKTKQTIFPT